MDEEQRRSIGAVVRTLRESRGLTRQDLVERTATDAGERVSLEMLAKVEQGKKAPSARTLRKLATALGMEPTDLARRAAWWELNESDGASNSLLRLGVTQAAVLGVRLAPRGRAAGSMIATVGVGAAAAVGHAALTEIADRRDLVSWLRQQAKLVEEGSEQDVEEVARALGLVLQESQAPRVDLPQDAGDAQATAN